MGTVILDLTQSPMRLLLLLALFQIVLHIVVLLATRESRCMRVEAHYNYKYYKTQRGIEIGY